MNMPHLVFVTAAGLFFSSTVVALTYDTNGGSSRGGGGYSGYTINQYIESSDGPLPNLPMGGDYSAVQNQMNQSRAVRNGQPYYNGGYVDLGEPPCHRARVRSAPRPCTPGNGCNSIKYPW